MACLIQMPSGAKLSKHTNHSPVSEQPCVLLVALAVRPGTPSHLSPYVLRSCPKRPRAKRRQKADAEAPAVLSTQASTQKGTSGFGRHVSIDSRTFSLVSSRRRRAFRFAFLLDHSLFFVSILKRFFLLFFIPVTTCDPCSNLRPAIDLPHRISPPLPPSPFIGQRWRQQRRRQVRLAVWPTPERQKACAQCFAS